MPLVDFVCTNCGTQKEALVKHTTEALVCTCGRPMLKRVGKPNFELKGAGWFKDGYTK